MVENRWFLKRREVGVAPGMKVLEEEEGDKAGARNEGLEEEGGKAGARNEGLKEEGGKAGGRNEGLEEEGGRVGPGMKILEKGCRGGATNESKKFRLNHVFRTSRCRPAKTLTYTTAKLKYIKSLRTVNFIRYI